MKTTRVSPPLLLNQLLFLLLPLLHFGAGAAAGGSVQHEDQWSLGPKYFSRIIGGTDAEPGEFPHQVSVQHKGFLSKRHVCGGTIMTEMFILTSASCIKEYTENSLSVVAGVIDLDDTAAQEVNVAIVIIHEDFNSETFSNNVALLKLKAALQLGYLVQPLALPPEGEMVSKNTHCTVIGWGATIESGDIHKQLQKAELTAVSDEVCRSSYGAMAIEDSMMCAGLPQEEADACNGDEGGPLLCLGNLHGVTSWGIGCAHPYYPRVFSEVAYYRNWIMMYISN